VYYIDDFIRHLREMRYSQSTINKYSSFLHHFEKYFQSFGFLDVKNVSENELLLYLKEIKKKRISQVEYSLKASRLKKYF